MNDLALIAIIIVLLILITLQVFSLIHLKKTISGINKFSGDLKMVGTKKFVAQFYKNLILSNPIKTCQNCTFRQAFLNTDQGDNNSFFYRCKINQFEIELEDSCSKFELVSSTKSTR